MAHIIAQGPPDSAWNMGSVVGADGASAIATLMTWVGWVSWIALALCGLAAIAFAAMLAIDKDRGRAISATSPHMELVKWGLGVMIISSAGALASTLYNLI
ncbi:MULTISPECIES: hypothetical protein [Corynebacterium]|uniref:hypothetical protein n=1 Tax=Corynebacterium TaxID=1716 RepID=UPI00114CC6A8|nr:hypothetical protein [Corynebacterium sp. HMSC08D02]